jgi:hypothetical protein
VRVLINQWAGLLVYLFAIAGVSLLGTGLLSLVADQVIVLALPHLDHGRPKLSLMERRWNDARLAAPPLPERAKIRVAALEAPSTPANILAARLDLAESEGPASFTHVASPADGSPSSIAVRVYGYEETSLRTVRSLVEETPEPGVVSKLSATISKSTSESARDVFNRSFGVLSVAAN